MMLFLFVGLASAQYCDSCSYVNCSVSGDCPAGGGISLTGMTFNAVVCDSAPTTDGTCRYRFDYDVGSSCAAAFPAAPDRRVMCAMLLEPNDEAECMSHVSQAPPCSGNTLGCDYRLLCGSEVMDNCTDADCAESCTNVETSCPLIDFNGADSDLYQTQLSCIASLSPLSGADVCSYRVSLNTSASTCFDAGSRTSDTMNNSNIEECNDALPEPYRDCLDAVEVRCTATVFECEYQLVECDQVLDCGKLRAREIADNCRRVPARQVRHGQR